MDGIVIGYGNYREYKAELDRELNRTAEGFVRIGYLLKVARDTDILKESGYQSLTEFAQAEYSLDASQVSRFIAINDKYSEGGYSETLLDQYQGFGYAKLSLMLTMPEQAANLLSPAYSKSEIQEIKKEIEEEQKISDLEVLTEQQEPRTENMTDLEKAIYQMGMENPELYSRLHQAAAGPDWGNEIHEVLAPAGENIISVRIKGTGRVMLNIKDAGAEVKLLYVRSNETAEYSWDEFTDTVRLQMDLSVSAKESWEKLYGEEWPIEEKKEIAPVQEKPAKKPEKKVIKAKPEPPKRKPKAVENFLNPPEKEEPKHKEPDPEVPAEEKSIPEGQMELVRDFPEYCPESKRLTERDEKGNWCLRGVTWGDLAPGKVITQEVWEHIYGALVKLKDYEDTGYEPEEIKEAAGKGGERCTNQSIK